MRKVKIKSLPKAQTISTFKPSYDFNKSAAENMELNRRAQVAGWNSVADYEKSGWAYNTKSNQKLNQTPSKKSDFSDWHFYEHAAPKPKETPFSDIDLKKINKGLLSGSAVAESTMPANMFKAPKEWEGLSGQQIIDLMEAQAAYNALPEALKRQDVLTADRRSDAEKFARRAWTAISHPMETIAAVNKGYDIPMGYLGMHDPYEGYNIGSPMTSVVDMVAGLPGFIGNALYRQGEQLVDNPLEYGLVNTFGLFDPKTRDQALSNYLDLAAVIPIARGASPLLRSAAKSTAGITKPSLLTNITKANATSYDDDLFRYLADAETSSGIDRGYLMGLSEDDFLRHRVLGNQIRDPKGIAINENLFNNWRTTENAINGRVPLNPPPSEIVIPFDLNTILQDARRVSGRATTPSVSDMFLYRQPQNMFRGIRRRIGELIYGRPRSQWSIQQGNRNVSPVNQSLFTKEEAKGLVKDKVELEKLEKLNDREFEQILLTPDGKVKLPEKYKGPKQITPIETKEWVADFNDNIDLLNKIIRDNNKSGKDFWVTGIDENGNLMFKTADGHTSTMHTNITPGRFRGEVQDIADKNYMLNEIPGLQMSSASPIFGFGDVPRGTRVYESLNEYLKKLDLGRIKSGMNLQSEFSRPLWENAIKNGKAYGYYKTPRTVYGIMKQEGGSEKKKQAGFKILTDANGKYVFVNT